MAKEVKISKEEEKWRLQDDMRTVKAYLELKNDKERYEKAKEALKKEAIGLLDLKKKKKRGLDYGRK